MTTYHGRSAVQGEVLTLIWVAPHPTTWCLRQQSLLTLWWLSHPADPLYQMRLHHQIAERLLHLQMAVRQKMNYPTVKHVIVICLVT